MLKEEVGYENDVVVSATLQDTTAWTDRNFNSGSIFFYALSDMKNDSDKDGVVSIEEAVKVLEEEGEDYMPWLREYILTEYKCDAFLNGTETRQYFIDSLSLQPLMSRGTKVPEKVLEAILENHKK